MEKVLHPHHEYKMVSTIEHIDHAKGNLKLKAHSGELAIHFPPGPPLRWGGATVADT
jgi:hypothetical protein